MSDWREAAPESLMLDPSPLSRIPRDKVAREAMEYARKAQVDSYDERAFRLLAATPRSGAAPMQSLPGVRVERKAQESVRMPREFAERKRRERLLEHRPIEFPSDRRFDYKIDTEYITLSSRRPGSRFASDEEVWTFPLKAPPESLLQVSVPRDEPLIASQRLRIDLPGVFWIPFPLLVETGRFRRMQEWRTGLTNETHPGNYYCFISHRWFTPLHPDPDNTQAAFIAWQALAHLCGAVIVANRRGLHTPRKVFQSNACVGAHGSPFAEALIVNILRPALDDRSLSEAAEQAAAIRIHLAGRGVEGAQRDSGLAELRGICESAPALATLLRRLYIWYDYGCMPQSPRTDEEETLFREALKYLNGIQALGRTAILLDEVEDYLSRGWCTLESLTADCISETRDLLVGARRPVWGEEGLVDYYFDMALQDRPHLVWRAVLDTEVFRVQDRDDCLARLNLATTDPADRAFIYQGLVRLGAPQRVHIDESEIVTGVLPLPVVGDAVCVPLMTGRALRGQSAGEDTRLDLDWSGFYSLAGPWQLQNEFFPRFPPYMDLLSPEETINKERAHVAIVASCEGEALLLARRICDQLGELEQLLGVAVSSFSWLASDIAAVGETLGVGFSTVPVKTDVWILAASTVRLSHCQTTSILQAAMKASGLRSFELALDASSGNVRRVEASVSSPDGEHVDPEWLRVPAAEFLAVKCDGLFRCELLDALRQPARWSEQ